MKIQKIEAIPLRVKIPNRTPDDSAVQNRYDDGRYHHFSASVRHTTIVKITTDTGLVGWGEAPAPVSPTFTTTVINDLLADSLIGEDPAHPARHWQRMVEATQTAPQDDDLCMVAISAVDVALWDIAAKAHDLPLNKLLGGQFRSRIKVCASSIPGLEEDDGPEQVEELRRTAEKIRSLGYQAIKVTIGLGVSADLRTVTLLRETLGQEFQIVVDARGVYGLTEAVELSRGLARLTVAMLEAPLSSRQMDGYVRLAGHSDVPIASDIISNRWHARDLLRAGGIDIVQPDVGRSGGLSECRRIAEVADAYGKAVTPHGGGSAIHTAASAHLAAALPNQTVMAYDYGLASSRNPIITEPFRVEGGYLQVPDGPGLGIQIDEDNVRRFAIQENEPV